MAIGAEESVSNFIVIYMILYVCVYVHIPKIQFILSSDILKIVKSPLLFA